MDARNRRVVRLRTLANDLFPGDREISPGLRELHEDIERSYLVPQIGDYHHEGALMDSHLELIARTIDQVVRGEFPESIPEFARKAMRSAVERDVTAVKKYVFLHDISKADCMTVKFGDDERPMTWPEWIKELESDPDGKKALLGDEAALRRFAKTKGITGISYVQQRGSTKVQHGDVGADRLRAGGVADDPTMLAAIETHEAAFLFVSPEDGKAGIVRARSKAYRDKFAEFSKEARDFAMLASYVDTMASLREDGKPNLTAFLSLAISREKFETLPILQESLAGASLDTQKFQKRWAATVDSPEPLSKDTLEAAKAEILEACKLASYDVEALGISTQALVDAGTLTAEDRELVVDLAEKDPTGIGRVLGSKGKGNLMGTLRPALNAALKK